MRIVSYAAQTVDSPNPLARFAHRSRIRLALRYTKQLCRDRGTVVDFGAGPGLFISTLKSDRPDINVIGFEPFMKPEYPGLHYVETMASVAPGSVQVFTAFEVCEHLYAHELQVFLADAQRILAPDGALLISVPIMYGLAILPKSLNWMMRARSLSAGYSLKDTASSLLGRPIGRPENPRNTHQGFDFRELRTLLQGGFSIERTLLSPIGAAPWWLNSQVFFICRPQPPLQA
jgi:2-polyprenyl-3-methyl-5-hydroxy-6-metoxy-1,4-benzoquinol methylase